VSIQTGMEKTYEDGVKAAFTATKSMFVAAMMLDEDVAPLVAYLSKIRNEIRQSRDPRTYAHGKLEGFNRAVNLVSDKIASVVSRV